MLKKKAPSDLWKEDLAAFTEELEVTRTPEAYTLVFYCRVCFTKLGFLAGWARNHDSLVEEEFRVSYWTVLLWTCFWTNIELVILNTEWCIMCLRRF